MTSLKEFWAHVGGWWFLAFVLVTGAVIHGVAWFLWSYTLSSVESLVVGGVLGFGWSVTRSTR